MAVWGGGCRTGTSKCSGSEAGACLRDGENVKEASVTGAQG